MPDTNAKAPLFTSEDVITAREWFVKVYSAQDPSAISPGAKKSRFARLALMVLSGG